MRCATWPTEMPRLTTISDEMRATFPAIVEEWTRIGLSTAPADRPTAEAGVVAAYRAAGLQPPERIVWGTSPLAGTLWSAVLNAHSVRASVGDSVEDRVGASVWASVWASVEDSVWASVGDSVWASVGASVRARVRASVGEHIWRACYGQHDAGWLSVCETLRQHGLADVVAPLDGIIAVARSAGWWWPRARVCLVTERPIALHRDQQGRLHHEREMAIQYPDGWGVYAVHGVRVPAQVVCHPETLTRDQVSREENVEVRRVMLERFGVERYLRESNARRVHRDDWGTLWSLPVKRDEPLTMVEVLNSTPEPDGSYRTYFLRVPPSMRRARQAIAWTFGMQEEDYLPTQQT